MRQLLKIGFWFLLETKNQNMPILSKFLSTVTYFIFITIF